MPRKVCCYGMCNSDTLYRGRPNRSLDGVRFLPFPKPLSQPMKCATWIQRCGREGFRPENVKKHTYICTKHFNDPSGPTTQHPDPIPVWETEEGKRALRKSKGQKGEEANKRKKKLLTTLPLIDDLLREALAIGQSTTGTTKSTSSNPIDIQPSTTILPTVLPKPNPAILPTVLSKPSQQISHPIYIQPSPSILPVSTTMSTSSNPIYIQPSPAILPVGTTMSTSSNPINIQPSPAILPTGTAKSTLSNPIYIQPSSAILPACTTISTSSNSIYIQPSPAILPTGTTKLTSSNPMCIQPSPAILPTPKTKLTSSNPICIQPSPAILPTRTTKSTLSNPIYIQPKPAILPALLTDKRISTKCVVVSCKNYPNGSQPFHAIPPREVPHTRWNEWLKAIQRIHPDGTPWIPLPEDRICGSHFTNGKPSEELTNIDYVPSIFPCICAGIADPSNADQPNQVLISSAKTCPATNCKTGLATADLKELSKENINSSSSGGNRIVPADSQTHKERCAVCYKPLSMKPHFHRSVQHRRTQIHKYGGVLISQNGQLCFRCIEQINRIETLLGNFKKLCVQDREFENEHSKHGTQYRALALSVPDTPELVKVLVPVRTCEQTPSSRDTHTPQSPIKYSSNVSVLCSTVASSRDLTSTDSANSSESECGATTKRRKVTYCSTSPEPVSPFHNVVSDEIIISPDVHTSKST